MMPQKRSIVAALLAALPLGVLMLTAGCTHKSQDAMTGPPPGSPGALQGGHGSLVSATATGVQIYQQKCQGCHGNRGQGARGPSLQRAAGRPAAQIAQVIHDGHGRMPAFGSQLTPAQITSVTTYVKQLPPGG